MKRIVLTLVFLSVFSIKTVEHKSHEVNPIVITKDSLASFKKSFPAYLQSKEHELKMLREWTGDGWFGSLCTYAIESFGPAFGLGDIDVKKAKTFLGRTFQDQQKLTKAIDDLENDQDNVTYLQEVFQAVDNKTIRKKSRPGLVRVMHTIRHKRVPNPSDMDLKKQDGSYEISDDNFVPYAVCNLFACHIIENHDLQCHITHNTKHEPYGSASHLLQS